MNSTKYFLDIGKDFAYADKLLTRFNQEQHLSNKPSSLKYYNLLSFPNSIDFYQSLGINKDFSDYTTIQQNIGRLPPHTDIERYVSLLCPVYGLADTVFYSSLNGEKTISRT